MIEHLPIVALYIDPGAGFLALQVLIGSLVGVGFYFRRTILGLRKRIGTTLHRKGAKTRDEGDR